MDEPDLRRLKQRTLIAGPALAGLVGLATHFGAGLPAPAAWTALVTVWCAVWWVVEPVPLAATSLIPFCVLPLSGVLDHREVAGAYGHHLVLLMIAGSMVSTAMERSDAHRRVAVGLIRVVGGAHSRRLVLGFLVASAALSMWMSNTATTIMLLPVALAAVASSRGEHRALALPLLLAVAYGASIGGSATPIGTPPNLIFIEHYTAATGREIGFTTWMGYGLPVVVIMIPLAWLWLSRGLGGEAPGELPKLGPWRPEERRVLAVFGLMALAWMTRSQPFGGWSGALGVEETAGDSSVAILATLTLFVLPRGDADQPGARLLDWKTANAIPWGVFIMIGGGIAIGKGFTASGLGAELGQGLSFLVDWPVWVVVPLLVAFATFTTEVTSNTAVANVLLPILAAAVAASGGGDPLWLMLPAVLGLNHAFMLPVATAPNAIMYGTGRVTTRQMAREGFVLNVVAIVVITALRLVWG